jgi:preprotein translocase subunit SecA
LDEKRREINLTEIGYEKTKAKLGKNFIRSRGSLDVRNFKCIKGKTYFQIKQRLYCFENKVLIVDEFSGRIMEDRRWSLGIHEAIEIKVCHIRRRTQTKSSITYQIFTLYPKLADRNCQNDRRNFKIFII